MKKVWGVGLPPSMCKNKDDPGSFTNRPETVHLRLTIHTFIKNRLKIQLRRCSLRCKYPTTTKKTTKTENIRNTLPKVDGRLPVTVITDLSRDEPAANVLVNSNMKVNYVKHLCKRFLLTIIEHCKVMVGLIKNRHDRVQCNTVVS